MLNELIRILKFCERNTMLDKEAEIERQATASATQSHTVTQPVTIAVSTATKAIQKYQLMLAYQALYSNLFFCCFFFSLIYRHLAYEHTYKCAARACDKHKAHIIELVGVRVVVCARVCVCCCVYFSLIN